MLFARPGLSASAGRSRSSSSSSGSARPAQCAPAPPPRAAARVVLRSPAARPRTATPNPPRAPAPRAAAPDATAPASSPPPFNNDDEPEVLFLETKGAPASLAFSVLMGATIVYLPLTIAAIGRYAWISIRFTNKRIEIINTSPLFKGVQQLAYSQIREVRSAPRAFDAWGDIVIFLKGAGGGTVELTGLERHREIVAYINERVEEARRKDLERKLREAGVAAGGAGGVGAAGGGDDE